MTHELVLQEITPVTHDTYQLMFGRPKDFTFAPGQAAELAFQKDGIKDEGRPFTMVSQPDESSLSFVIKSYPDHDGVTEHVPDLGIGDIAQADGPFGAIQDHGAGVFLAAGAGVTPFIAILKKHEREGIKGDTLIFANKTDDDIILKETWESLAGVDPIFYISDQDDTAYTKGKVDQAELEKLITDKTQPFYICGPGGFVDAMRDALKDMGVADDKIITEDGW
ncbi:MAG: FAD-binding oxidoreductase [Yoonia sp.]|uniref:FAD-binding oxidoreductase n=1 Tax=Yoonia sp. TaxID=2212373 RepID=UPI003264185F